MRAEELAARSVARAADNDRAVLEALAGAGDAGVQPGRPLAELAGLPQRTTSEVVVRLIALGLARRDGKRRVWATEAGLTEAGAHAPGLSLAPTLDVALACFPAEAMRAFARLQLAAVPARWHLAGELAAGWSGFIGLGPTKTGKTSIAALVCRVFGIDELAAVKVAQHETPGSLYARKVRTGASATGYRAVPSPLLELPYACIDEWDKAPPSVQTAAGGLLLGTSAGEHEGERVTIRPTVYITLNTGRDGLRVLHEAHVRRSVVLDTTELRPLLADIDEHMARLFASQQVAIPRLALERLRPPAPALPDEVRALLRSALRAGLTDEGWSHADVEPLARIALGRAALTSGPLEQAALATALDYLTCAATLGHARPGFAAQLARQLGAQGPLVPDPAEAEAQLESRRQAERAAEHKAASERLRFQADRERKAGEVLAARDAMGRRRDIERQALARALTAAARDIRAARGREVLEASWQAAVPYLEQARRWAQAQDAAALERAREADQARQQRELEREAQRIHRQGQQFAEQQRRQQRRQMASELRALRAEIAKLDRLAARKTTRPDERPLELLRDLRVLGQPVVVFIPDERPEKFGLDRLTYAFSSLSGITGIWSSPWEPSLTLPGSQIRCEQLESWQAPATQRALAAALEPMRTREAQLARQVRATPPRKPAVRAKSSKSAGRRSPRSRPAKAAKPAEQARCPNCGTVYKTRGLFGLRVGWCTKCNQRLEPLSGDGLSP